MKLRRAFLILASLFGFASVATAQVEGATPADPDPDSSAANLPKLTLTPRIAYQLLLGEIALNRGDVQVALGAYLDLARSTQDPRIAKRAAEIAIYARQPDAALQAARLWVSADPGSAPARQMLAGLLIATNQTDHLAENLAQMLALEQQKGNIGEALMSMGRLLARIPDHKVVEQLVQQLTGPYLALPEAHFARAHAAQVIGEPDKAQAEIDQALKLRPAWDQAVLFKAHLVQKTPGAASKVLADFLKAHPESRDVRLAYARSLVGDKRYDDARREFRALLDGSHDDPDIIYAVAILSLQLNDRSQAETQFKRLLDMGYAESDNIRLQLGQMAEEDKRWQDAVGWYGQVSPGSEQFVTAQARAAHLLADNGRMDEGRHRLQEAAATYPQERAQFRIAESILLRDAGRVSDAYDVLDQALKESPDQADILYEQALLADRLNKPDVLERNLRRVIQLKPDYAHAYNALGYTLADHNERLDEAQRLIDKALSLAPDDPYILDSKGWLLYRRGDNPGALEVLQHALSLRPDPEIAAHVGEVQWAMGHHADAEKTWRDAATANPGNEALTAVMKKYMP